MTKGRKVYPGELGEPIPWGRIRSEKDWREEIDRRMTLLMRHYGRSENSESGSMEDWIALAYFLALDHVPGFTQAELPKRRKNARARTIADLYLPQKRKLGRKRVFHEDSIQAIRERLPDWQSELRRQGKPASRRDALRAYLQRIAVKHRKRSLKGHLKTLENQIDLASRNSTTRRD